MKKGFDWVGSGALNDIVDAKREQKSLKDILVIIRDKYQISVTPGRISQVYSKYLLDKESLNNGS